MGKFGLWNPNILHQAWDNNDGGQQQQYSNNGTRSNTNNGSRNRQAEKDQRGPPRSIGYGTIAGNLQSNEDQNTTKEVRWDDDFQEMELSQNLNDYHDRNDPIHEGESSSVANSETSPEQELPSLTGAFQSLENRKIILHCFLFLLIYLTIAVVAYSFVLEKWTIIDSLYFAVSTFTTCGYGDKEPTTIVGKLFTIFFAIYGVVILGVFIAIFGSFISEAQTKTMKRFQRKQQHQMMETLFGQTSSERPELEDTGFWQDHVSLVDDVWKVLCAESALILLVAAMSLILGLREGWDWASTLYFCIMAATTTGYGDYTPTNQLDKLYCIFLLPLAVAVFGEILGRIATVYIQRKQQVAQQKFLHRSLTLCDIRNMDSDDDGRVDMADFLSFMLIALQKVDRKTIEELKTIFRSLDSNGNGLLEEEDLDELAQENYLPTLAQIRKELRESSANFDRRLLKTLLPTVPNQPTSPSSKEEDSPTKLSKHKRSHTLA